MTSEEKQHFLRLAIAEARRGAQAGQGGPFGAVVVKEGVVLATASNGVLAGNDPTAHAEVQAIRQACKALGHFHLTDCDVFASCEPCPMCLFALCWARPRAIYYAATREDAARIGFADEALYRACEVKIEALPVPCERVHIEEARTPFDEYASRPGRIIY